MTARCHDCAFTRGTEANRTDHTLMAATLCVLAHEPFMCHVEDRVCAGYVEASKVFAPERPNEYARQMGDLFSECVRLTVAEQEKRMEPAVPLAVGAAGEASAVGLACSPARRCTLSCSTAGRSGAGSSKPAALDRLAPGEGK